MMLLRCVLMLLFVSLSGCHMNQVRSNLSDQIQVFGIELHSRVDYREIRGVRATEEPCLKGYERSFDRLDISIGYGFDGKIRKISTRNYATNMFGITPGMPAEAGKLRAQQAGFTVISPFRYRRDGVSLTLLVDGNDSLFGLTVEMMN